METSAAYCDLPPVRRRGCDESTEEPGKNNTNKKT
jgi:hypothetical protein